MSNTRTTFLADVHLGNPKRHGGPTKIGVNWRGELVMRAFEWALSRRAGHYVICGDLFDSSHPPAQLIERAAAALRKTQPSRATVLCGNHDQVSGLPKDNAVGCLWPNAYPVDGEPLVVKRCHHPLTLVPFRPGPAKTWLPEVLDRASKDDMSGTILCIHLGISDEETVGYLSGSNDSVSVDLLRELCDWHGFEAVVAGNWHEHRVWDIDVDGGDGRIVQVGATAPTGFSNPGHDDYGWVSHWDGSMFEHERVPGPRFVVMEGPLDAQDLREKMDPVNQYFIEGRCQPHDAQEVREVLEEMHATLDHVEAWSLRVVRPEARAKAREAAKAARAAETLEEAVRAFVAGMELKEGVEPKEVLELAAGYLKGDG